MFLIIFLIFILIIVLLGYLSCINLDLFSNINKNNSNLICENIMKTKLELYYDNFKNNIVVWARGVDKSIFKPKQRNINERKILLSVSRVSIEKNLDIFCSIKTDARKILVGDGPYLETLKK